MNDSAIVKFRKNAVTRVVRDSLGITVYAAGVDQPITLKFAQLSEQVRTEAMGYGMEVRLTRAAALDRDSRTGKAASPQEKFQAIKQLADHYATGTDAWTMGSGKGGGLGADARALIEALVRALEMDPGQAEAAVREMDAGQRDQLRVDEEIKPYLDEVYAERAKAAGGSSATKALIERLKNRG